MLRNLPAYSKNKLLTLSLFLAIIASLSMAMNFKSPFGSNQQITSQQVTEQKLSPTPGNSSINNLEVKRGNCAPGTGSTVTFTCGGQAPQTLTSICTPFDKLVNLATSTCK